MTDIDGNTYKTITIGTQTWFAENLKVTHFRNGDPIPHETDLSKWGYFQITTSAYCWYNNDTVNKKIYGALYNWYAATDARNPAPEGWHVPTVNDWQILADYLNPYNYSPYRTGYKIREKTTAHWLNEKDVDLVTNEYGFSAVPGGMIAQPDFGFAEIGYRSYYWTSNGTMDGSSCVHFISEIQIDNLQPNCRGFSIRCVKD